MNGTPRQIRGLGDEQAMRAFLLAIATGRRINEILMMDFAPLSPVPGLDTSKAARDGGPAARLRYQQTKIAGAPQAILVGADVVAIVAEQQEFARALVRAGDPAAADPPYLFLAWQANTAGARHYRANTLNGLLTQLAAALQVTDATGALVDFQRTHRMRHTKATDLLNAGVPIHVVQRYMGHVSPEMTMHYAKTLAETHEAEFLRFAKLRRDGRPLEMDPADVYELVQLDRHTDRILPNGVCLLPPPKRCDRGNACLTCDHFATDARHLDELRAQLAATEELIKTRQAQHRQRTGAEMGPGHVWLAGRNAGNWPRCGRSSPRSKPGSAGAVRGAGVPARPGQPVPVTISRKPGGHGMPAEQDRIATLRQAAAAKREAAVARAETGIRTLTKTGQPITFRAVAAAGGVSVDFLYRHPELRARIERLRGHQPAPAGTRQPANPATTPPSSVVATLTARLTELRRELAETKAQLAAAHGELLALRRHPGNAAPGG